MKKLIILIIIIIILNIDSIAQVGNWTVAKSFGGMEPATTAWTFNVPYHIQMDSYGNSYLFATYGVFTELGGVYLPGNTNNRGHFLAKFNCLGEVEWFSPVHCANFNTSANWMQIKNDTIYIMGDYRVHWGNTVHLHDSTFITGMYDPEVLYNNWGYTGTFNYLAKFDLYGNKIDMKLFQTLNFSRLTMAEISPFYFAQDGTSFFTFEYRIWNTYPILLDSVPITDSLHNHQYFNYVHFLLKFTPSMEQVLWYKPFIDSIQGGTHCGMKITDLVVDSQENMYFTGSATIQYDSVTQQSAPPGTIYFMDGHSMEFPENGGNLGFIMKINNQGICEWLQQTSRIVNIPTTFDVPSSFKNICINEEDNEIYVTGHGNAMVSSCCLDFFTLLPNNDTVLGAFEDSGNTINFIAKFSTNGDYLGHSVPKTTGSSVLGKPDFYNNNIYVGLLWSRELYYLDTMITHDGNKYIYLAGFSHVTYNTDLEMIEVRNIPTEGDVSTPYGTKVDPAGNIWFTGRFNSDLQFGDTTLYAGTNSIFFARYGKDCPVYVDTTIYLCFGECFNASQQSFCNSGVHQAFIETPGETDTIYNLDLYIMTGAGLHNTDTTICVNTNLEIHINDVFESYLWSNGSTSNSFLHYFDTPGTYTVSVKITNNFYINEETIPCLWTEEITVNVDICSSEKLQQFASLRIYPNPARNSVEVIFPEVSNATIILFDSSGRVLQQKNVNGSQSTLDLQEYKPGMYYIKLFSEEFTVSEKLLIQN
ncbi:MAG: T9SS type A sorting domain-containing protein [Bacteroidales bacterium]|nr:T9SS type A sorting domain-containing protein [Bacteroidales bacterium]